MKRMLHRLLPVLVCCTALFFASGSVSSAAPPAGVSVPPRHGGLPGITSQKSEYDYLYGTKLSGSGLDEVHPLPNAFTHPEPQPLD